MRRDQHRCPLNLSVDEELEHLDRQVGVQVARGLVGQEQRGLGHQGTGDRDALALTGRQRVWVGLGAVDDPHSGEVAHGPPTGLFGRDAAHLQGQLHVLHRRPVDEQSEVLKHEPDASAQVGQTATGEDVEVQPADQGLARGGALDPQQDP